MIPIYNQSDYIICQQKQKGILSDEISYKGTSVNSDHCLIVNRISIEFYTIYKPNNKPKTLNHLIVRY